ncbi:MAG: L-threonylcarbamoyladenylate synthase [Solirubrobacteraceae bacterium]|jgi:L-threonylcarbamoyladenylate synthase|nr:L-threonylcarbamoyladenylate synthase [Solirubrobacteraceae bacterium]
MTADDAAAFERCIADGGVAVFPADTVYGLACDPASARAVERMYALKGRRPDKPSATMFFARDQALATLPALPRPTHDALVMLLPGPVTVVLAETGLRVPALDGPLAPLRAVRHPVLQTSANYAGGPDPRTLDEVPPDIRDGADVLLDGGPLPGTPSTVVDLRTFGTDGAWTVLREGAVSAEALAQSLSSVAP